MPLGIVCGFVRNSFGAPVPNVDVVLASITTAERSAISVSALSPQVGRPPYGIAGTSQRSGVYWMVFDWPGTDFGTMASNVRTQVQVLDPSRRAPIIGSGSATGCTWTADVRSVAGAFLPGVDLTGLLTAMADGRRLQRPSSGFTRGLLSDPVSTDVRSVIIHLNPTLR